MRRAGPHTKLMRITPELNMTSLTTFLFSSSFPFHRHDERNIQGGRAGQGRGRDHDQVSRGEARGHGECTLHALSVCVVVPVQVEAVIITQYQELEDAGDLGVAVKNFPKVVFDNCVDSPHCRDTLMDPRQPDRTQGRAQPVISHIKRIHTRSDLTRYRPTSREEITTPAARSSPSPRARRASSCRGSTASPAYVTVSRRACSRADEGEAHLDRDGLAAVAALGGVRDDRVVRHEPVRARDRVEDEPEPNEGEHAVREQTTSASTMSREKGGRGKSDSVGLAKTSGDSRAERWRCVMTVADGIAVKNKRSRSGHVCNSKRLDRERRVREAAPIGQRHRAVVVRLLEGVVCVLAHRARPEHEELLRQIPVLQTCRLSALPPVRWVFVRARTGDERDEREEHLGHEHVHDRRERARDPCMGISTRRSERERKAARRT
jgi:hypothetical protein